MNPFILPTTSTDAHAAQLTKPRYNESPNSMFYPSTQNHIETNVLTTCACTCIANEIMNDHTVKQEYECKNDSFSLCPTISSNDTASLERALTSLIRNCGWSGKK